MNELDFIKYLLQVLGVPGLMVGGLFVAIKHLIEEFKRKDDVLLEELRQRVSECEDERKLCIESVLKATREIAVLTDKVIRAVNNNTAVMSKCQQHIKI